MTKIRNDQQPLPELMALHPILGSANATSIQILTANAVPCSFERGARIYDEGELASRCLLIENGEICLVCYTEQGEEYLRNHFVAGSLVALPVMFMEHGCYPASAKATTPILGYWVSRKALNDACHQDGPLALACLRYTSEMLRQSLIKSYSLATTDCAHRLAEYVLRLHTLQNRNDLELPLRIGQLAGNLGMRGETLSRVLSNWRRQGLISGRGNKVNILDLESLQLMSDPNGLKIHRH